MHKLYFSDDVFLEGGEEGGGGAKTLHKEGTSFFDVSNHNMLLDKSVAYIDREYCI